MTLNAGNGWRGSFSNLPKYDAQDRLYYYYALETTVGGKPAAESGYTIHHYNQPAESTGNPSTTIVNVGSTDITVTKTWRDHNDAYGTRPDDLALVLYRKTATGRETVVTDPAPSAWSESNNVWTCTYSHLPESDDQGNLYTYRVAEPSADTATGEDRYEVSQHGYTLSNTLTGTVDVPVTKIWLDGSDADGLRPESITLVLLANGEPNQRYTLEAPGLLESIFQGDTWHYTFEDLAKYDSDGKEIQYTVQEEPVPGYKTETDQSSYTITNTLLTDFPVTKIWGGIPTQAQEEVTVGLYRSDSTAAAPAAVTGANGLPMTLTLSPANGWSSSFTDLERFSSDGARYLYSVEELAVGDLPAQDSGYLIHVNPHPVSGAVISNIQPISIQGTKTWIDNSNAYGTRPEELELTLERTVGTSITSTTRWEAVASAQPQWQNTDTDVWSYSYSQLPATTDQGIPYTYRVRETVPATATGQDRYLAGQDGYDLTNTLDGIMDIPVVKVWVDNGGAFGQRPDSITVHLLANGQETGQSILLTPGTGLLSLLGDSNQWKGTFTGLPKYDADGRRISYTVVEAQPSEGYQVSYGPAVDGGTSGGLTLTNTGEGRLLIRKTVTGSKGSHTKPFTFTLSLLEGTEGDPVPGSFPCVITRQDGMLEKISIAHQGTLSLRDGETALIRQLPGGTVYQVAESDNSGYRVTQSGASGVIAAGKELTAQFTNYRGGGGTWDETDPPPGDLPHTGQNWALPVALAFGGIVALSLGFCSGRRRRHGPKD